MTWQTQSAGSAQTEALAEKLAKNFRGGEIIELTSDLGGGKTTFVRGLARGMGSSDHVASPTFTVSREYKAGDLTLYHFDFYRLNDPGIVADELAEFIEDQKAVVVVEWAGIVSGVLPAGHVTILLRATGETTRDIQITYPESLAYILEGVR